MHFDLPRIEFPEMPLDIPESVGIPDIKVFGNLKDDLESRIINGQLVDGRIKGIEELERRIQSGVTNPSDLIRKARDIRLLVGWWRVNGGASQAAPFNRKFLRQFNGIRPQLSLQALFGLIEVYFKDFDWLEDLKPLGVYLRGQLEQRAQRSLRGQLSVLLDNRDLLFDHRAPNHIAALATQKDKPLAVIISGLGVGATHGRFFDCCQQIYYLETLKGLKVGQEHSILGELAQKTVHESPYGKGFLLGHEVIKQIVDMAADLPVLPDSWLHLILEIAGDPRIHHSTARFTRWWARLDDKVIAAVRRWLSHMDLSMFLEVLEDYSNQSGLAMKRMFPARKRFLLGLFESELIRDSRLYLSRKAAQYVKRHYNGKEYLSFARNSDAEISVLYVNVEGFHVFEGTHNFSFRIHTQLPRVKDPVHDYTTREFPIRNLGVGLTERVTNESGKAQYSISHVSEWQHKVIIEFKRLGVKIDPSKVLTRDDYKYYKRRYGV